MLRLFLCSETAMKTKVYRPTPTNLARLSGLLARGELVAVPAETVYGLAADATNEEACTKIFKAKNRPMYDPLIVHVATIKQAKQVAEWTPEAETLAKQFWPGPLTLVLQRKSIVSDTITAGLNTVAVRMPSHPTFRALLRAFQRPLAAPSANRFGYISPTSAQHVKDGLGGRIPAILDGGECPMGVESTIVSLSSTGQAKLLRPGAISAFALERWLREGTRLRRSKKKSSRQLKPQAPGLLDRHYSPRTPTRLRTKFPRQRAENEAWIWFKADKKEDRRPPHEFVLSADGTGESAANRLFALLRKVDKQGFDTINLERVPSDEEWSETLNDRMVRASAT
jgi:L-threonylcarbamoyladenylate synthase